MSFYFLRNAPISAVAVGEPLGLAADTHQVSAGYWKQTMFQEYNDINYVNSIGVNIFSLFIHERSASETLKLIFSIISRKPFILVLIKSQ